MASKASRRPDAKRRAQSRKIEELAHQLDVIGYGVDDLDLCVADAVARDVAEVHVGGVKAQDLGDFQRLGVDRVRDLLWRRAAVGGVELDAEVAIRTAGVMAGREDQAAEGLVLANDAGGGRRGQNAAGADQKTPDAICGGDADDGLDRLRVIIAAIPADHERVPGQALRQAGRH